MIFGQSVMADQGGHYVPRAKENTTAAAYLHSLRANQHTGMIDPAWLIAASKQVESSSKDDAVVYWKSMGPDNMGGRTTAVLYNNQNTNEAYIGSMGGGVFYTWNMGISWHQVGENLLVSCMAQAEDGTIYVGTGDCGPAYTYNGLGDLAFENSFIGTGLYKIKNKEMTLVEGTNPSDNNDSADEWAYINDVAVDGSTVIVATGAGVKYLKDGSWRYAKVGDEDLTGVAHEVKVGSDHTVVASVDGKIYIGALNNMICKSSSGANDALNDGKDTILLIGTATGLVDIAIAPSDPQRIYAANIKNNGNHVKFYSSEDQGETWNIILPTVTNVAGHQVYNTLGLYYHGLVVDPTNPDRLYVMAENMWLLNRANPTSYGYYQALQLTNASSIHVGINDMAFSPTQPNTAYVATDGGIYKATRTDDTYFSFLNCNRGYISTRCLGVAPSGKLTRVVAGLLDHGPILINGLEGTNNMETGDLLLPALTGAHYGSFDASENAANCFVSVIDPDAFLLSTVDGGLYRTFNAGVDYDASNFKTSVSYTGYRVPMAYWECFDDEYSMEEVQFKCKKDQKAGDVVICYSNAGGYPFEYTLPQDMHYDTLHPAHSDSIYVLDPIATKFFVAEEGTKFHDVYYTIDAMNASKAAEWFYVIGEEDSISSYMTCMAVSADGDNLFVGTDGNEILRVSNLRRAVIEYYEHLAAFDTLSVIGELKKGITLPTDGQVVTSISVCPEDANKMVVTLGNYGNQNYVLYCDNALSDNPTFTSKQGNLPAMPVYTSVYANSFDGTFNGHVLIGTDHGVFRTTNIEASSPVWTLESDNLGDVPVMDLKQQSIYREDFVVTTVVDDVPVEVVYPGTNNQGVIYAATYGRGLFRCEAYRQHSGNSVPETPVVAESSVTMYPNPVRDAAKVCFELNDNTAVSYQVYDMSGRMVKTESLGNFAEGKHEVNVNMNGLAKGAYVLRLNAGSRTSSVKFMML